jgi:hypothetical protein
MNPINRNQRRRSAQVVLLILIGLALAAGLASLSGTFGKLRTGLLAPAIVLAAVGAMLAGQEIIIYLLAIVWVIPITTAGIRPIAITQGLTAWELLLYAGFAVAVISGRVRLLGRTRRNGIQDTRLANWIWVGLLIVSMGSWLAVSKTNAYGYGNFRYVAINPLILFVLATSLIKSHDQLLKFSLALCVGAAAAIVIQLSSGFNMETGRLSARLVSLFGEEGFASPNRIGLWVSTVMPLALCFAIGAKKQVLRLLSMLLYLALAFVVVITFSRGSMLAAAVGSALILLLVRSAGYRRQSAIAYGLMISGAFLIVWYVSMYLIPNVSSFFVSDITNRLESFNRFFSGEESIISRMELWRLSFHLIASNPMGIGYGIITAMTGYWEHNMFIMVMNGGGIVALIGLFVFLISYLIVCFHAVRRTKGLVRLLLIAVLGSTITTMINGLVIELLAPNYGEPSLLVLALGLCALRLSHPTGRPRDTLVSVQNSDRPKMVTPI